MSIYVMRDNVDRATGRLVMEGDTTDPMRGQPTKLRIETRDEGGRENRAGDGAFIMLAAMQARV